MKKLIKYYCFFVTLSNFFACQSNEVAKDKQAKIKKQYVAIQPFTNTSPEKIALTRQAIENFYGFPTMVLVPTQAPKTAFIDLKSPRYRADSLLIYLWKKCPDSISYILGLADFDISITKRENNGKIKQPIEKYTDFGIYGLGYCPGKSCIVSYYRLGDKNKKKETNRLIKVVLHEFGHNLGLAHCPDTNCLMQDAKESMKTIDKESDTLCKNCKQKIKQDGI